MAVPTPEPADDALRDVVDSILSAPPARRLALISSLDAQVRSSTLGSLMENVELPDDARLLDPDTTCLLPTAGCVEALLQNAQCYGPFVRRLKVTDPFMFSSPTNPPPTLLQFEDGASSDFESATIPNANLSGISPMPTVKLQQLLSSCLNLERFEWRSATPPPDGLCELLSISSTKLTTCVVVPPPLMLHDNPAARQALPRWDAPSLLHLSTLPLTTLHIHRLSQSGARSLAALFVKMGEYSNLEDVWLDFLWLDDTLCESLVSAGRRMKRLRLGTSGTKLTDKGVVAILEGCDNLEEISLLEVQGRLSRNLWSKIPDLPSSMKALNIATSEAGPHHSWTMDHLASLPCLSIDVLEALSITRTVHPFSEEVDDLACLQCVPRDLLDKLKEDSISLTHLNLDFWGWEPADLKELLVANQQLEELSITLDAPLAKLLALSSTFANMQHLRILRIRIPERHAPGNPVQQYHLQPSQSPHDATLGLMTPAASPVTSARGMMRPQSSPLSKPSLLPPVSQATQFQTPPATPSDAFSTLSLSFASISPFTAMSMSVSSDKVPPPPAAPVSRSSSDASFPNPREIQKFARRCPKLETLDWYGRNGRGSWTISRETSSSSFSGPTISLSSSITSASGPPSITATAGSKEANTVTVKAEHIPPYFPSAEARLRASLEGEADMWGWEPTIPRLGNEWTGPAAEVWYAEQEKERLEAAHVAAAAAEALATATAAAAIANADRAAAVGLGSVSATPTKKAKASGLPRLDTNMSSSVRGGPGSGSSRRRSSSASVTIMPPTKSSTNGQIGGVKNAQDISESNVRGGARRGGGGANPNRSSPANGRSTQGTYPKRRFSGADGGSKVDVLIGSPARPPSNASPTTARFPISQKHSISNGPGNSAAQGGLARTKPSTTGNGRQGSSVAGRRSTAKSTST